MPELTNGYNKRKITQLLNEVKQKGPYAAIRIPFAQLEQVFIASFCQRKAQNTHLGHHRLCGYSEEISSLHYVIEKIYSRERTSGRTTAHGCSKLQILPYLRNYRFLWKVTRSFCRYSRLLHVSTLILTSYCRAVVLEIRMARHTDTKRLP